MGNLLAPWTMLTSGSGLLPRTMSWSMALLQMWSVLMSVVPVITEGNEDTWSLGCHIDAQEPCHCKVHPELLGAMEASRPELQTRVMSRFTLTAASVRVDIHCASEGLGHHLGPCRYPRATLPLEQC